MLFEDQLFLDCRWGESTLQCSADQLNQSLRDDDRRCTRNKIDAIISIHALKISLNYVIVPAKIRCEFTAPPVTFFRHPEGNQIGANF
ncbi:hypothetical protein RhiirA4_402782 [Rhizophagus irregularis]|uniref:Uncharacterized protein n=1 Tax=Rhizophagus irregularis TaxID=588596 RepID=A0A2I1GJF6_9GLOM|nr:hypothetical protein RhiirA4_402782 [Rhizophagus irregularis]